VAFVRARDLGLQGTELAEHVDASPELLRAIESMRAHASVAMGLAPTPEVASATRPGTPKLAFVAPPTDFRTQDGWLVRAEEVSLVARIMSMGTLHRSYAVTGGIATAAAAAIRGTVVHEMTGDRGYDTDLIIGHPSGVLAVGARVALRDGVWHCDSGIAYRSARALMRGEVLVPASVLGPAGGGRA
jgi:2-methylaconitate isomerase